ncbi:hypothetical protein ACIP6Q_32525 [Streptomyces bobili]|uniref:hypothetical protein n=1 Tax=Streptomyces bobili TaxID=67280 RepID=UPI00382752BA
MLRRTRAWARGRFALLLLPALCTLSACGIPATGVVEAGEPAGGIVPTVWVFFVTDDSLVGVPRRTAGPVDVGSALRILFQGPTAAERTKRMTTQLATAPAVPTTPGAVEASQEPSPAAPMKVTVRQDRTVVELSASAGKTSRLAAWQIICTAVAAQRLSAPGAAATPVTVVGADGRRYPGTPEQCPHG